MMQGLCIFVLLCLPVSLIKFSVRAGDQLTARLPESECKYVEIASIRKLKTCTNMGYPAQEVHPGHAMSHLVPKIACDF